MRATVHCSMGLPPMLLCYLIWLATWHSRKGKAGRYRTACCGVERRCAGRVLKPSLIFLTRVIRIAQFVTVTLQVRMKASTLFCCSLWVGGENRCVFFFFKKRKPETNAGCRSFGNPRNFPRDKELEEGELIFMLAPKCGNVIGTSGTKQ